MLKERLTLWGHFFFPAKVESCSNTGRSGAEMLSTGALALTRFHQAVKLVAWRQESNKPGLSSFIYLFFSLFLFEQGREGFVKMCHSCLVASAVQHVTSDPRLTLVT